MKDLERAFRYCLIAYLIFNYVDIKAQTANKIAIDTLFIENKLYALIDKEKSKNKELSNEQYRVMDAYIVPVLDRFSNEYLFFEGYKAFSFGQKATYMMAVYCVWDIRNNKFIDTIDYVNFNKIVASMNITLNSYDKAVLYELLTFRELPGRYLYNLRVKKKHQAIHAKKLDLNTRIYKEYFLNMSGTLDLTCNKEIYDLLNSSTNQILYLPRVTFQNSGLREIKEFIIQVFYFNEEGELVNTTVLEKFMTLKPCD